MYIAKVLEMGGGGEKSARWRNRSRRSSAKTLTFLNRMLFFNLKPYFKVMELDVRILVQ